MIDGLAIHWFRQDLRLVDNPALRAACEYTQVLCLYILDDDNAGDNRMGAASRWWLHHSLNSLQKSLGGRLHFARGEPATILRQLTCQYEFAAVFWNRCYEPWQRERDTTIKEQLRQHDVHCESFNGSLLFEPWEILKDDRTHYRVFTPYYRRMLQRGPIRQPYSRAQPQVLFTLPNDDISLDKLGLLPSLDWHRKLESHWHIGEAGAQQCLDDFVEGGLAQYHTARDFPAQASTSRLSSALHFGELSPQQAWYATLAADAHNNGELFRRQLVWREFSYQLLFHNPSMDRANLREKFDAFPWRDDPAALDAWQRGTTGIPIIDAGMRELWQTGYMHNRVRMLVASFLVKNLLIDWRKGARWFWDCLVDADLANNSASWQWVAGCGTDAAPYFRIFNPVSQAQKFDPNGHYIKHYVPELRRVPDHFITDPSQAPSDVLAGAGVTIDVNYPAPIVDLKTSRERALAIFKQL